jgi:protein-S-isoprenylcysteine O-methyltransferase Ste14
MKKRLSAKNASGSQEVIIPLDEYSVVNVGGLVLALASFWIKLSDEEEVMRKQWSASGDARHRRYSRAGNGEGGGSRTNQFPDQYSVYEERVKRIIPFIL